MQLWLNNRVERVGCAHRKRPIFLFFTNIKHLVLVLTLVWCWLNDSSLTIQGVVQQFINLFIKWALVPSGRTIPSQNSLEPPPQAVCWLGYCPLLWDVSSVNHLLQVNHCGCICHYGTNSTPKLMPQVFNGVVVWTTSRLCIPSFPF